jgi:hypothetical protein
VPVEQEHSRTSSSSASTSTSPVTTGAIAASHVIAAAASPSSHAPSDPPPSDAAARRAAHRARTWTVHCSSSAELPSSRSRSARETWTQALTGWPARSGSRSLAASRRMRQLGFCIVSLITSMVTRTRQR